MHKRSETVQTVKIIRDCRDATRDYRLSRPQALRLYEAGGLAWDKTNGAYCHHHPDDAKFMPEGGAV